MPQSPDDKAALAEATHLNSRAIALYKAGKFSQAEPLLRRALAIAEKTLPPDDPNLATSLNNLAQVYRALGQYSQAELLYRRALAIREKALGSEHPAVAQSFNGLASVYKAQGDYIAAGLAYRFALAILERALGAEHLNVAQSLNNLAFLLARQAQAAKARPLYERARRILLAVSRANIDLDEEARRSLLRQESGGLYVYTALLATIAPDPTLDPSGPPAALEAFVVAEQTRGGVAQAALARAGARAAAGDPATAQLARQVQELRDRRQAVQKQLTDEYGKPTAQRNATRLGALQQQSQQTDRELAEASERLLRAFPRYAELAAPEPIDPATVGQLVRPDEALMSYFTLADRVLVWLLRPGQAPVYRDIVIKRAELAKRVERVRQSLDQSLNSHLTAGKLLPFDVARAHELYTLLLARLRQHLAGVKHLLMVPDKVLLPLPFGVLC